MAKIRLTSYTFDAAAKTVTAGQFSDVGLAGIQLIVNVTDQIIIYNFADTSKGGTLSTDTLTLEYDTTSMSNTDELMILVEDGIQTIAVTQSGTWDEIGINDSGNSITVDNAGTFAVQAAQSGTWNVGTVSTITNVVHVDDNASTLSVDDGGGSITVDGTVAVSGTVTVGSHAVTNAGTFVVQENGAALTALQLIDDTVYTDGTGTVTKGIAILGQDGTNPQAIKTDASGELQVDVLTMPTVAVTQSGTWDEVGINDSGNSITVDDGGATLSIDDGAGSITVDGTVAISGTVTVASHAVTNAGTFATQVDGAALTALQLIDNPVVVDDAAFTPATTSVMMAGFEYDDTTPDGVNEGDAGAARMSANRNIYVQLRDNAGNERGLNIDANGEIGIGAIRSALPAGTNAIGKLAANSGVDIGDVDVTTVGTITPGTAAANLGKAEDAAHASGDTGVFMLAVRNDNLGTTYGADQDYAPVAVDLKGAVITTQKAATSSQSSVAGSATSVTVLAASSARRGAIINNDSTAILYLKLGATASTTSYTYKMYPDDCVEIPFGYTGIIDGIWASATGNARITELS